MSQSQALQTETVMTQKEAEQLAIIEEMVEMRNLFKDAWVCEHYQDSSQIIKYKQHEPHENCTGNLVVAEIIGRHSYRRAISHLIVRSPTMAKLLEKALPIIRAEAEMREAISGAPFSDGEGYFTEMRLLANEIEAEINKARGK
jgi:hypothetical protein